MRLTKTNSFFFLKEKYTARLVRGSPISKRFRHY